MGVRAPEQVCVFSSVADNYREASWGDLRGKERLFGCGPAGSVLTLEGLFWVLEAAVPGYLLRATALLCYTWYFYTNSGCGSNSAQPTSHSQHTVLLVLFF